MDVDFVKINFCFKEIHGVHRFGSDKINEI